MTNGHFYPPFSEAQIATIIKIYDSNPGYLEDPKCPYLKDTKDFIRNNGKQRDYFTADQMQSVPETNKLITQINALNQELQKYGETISKSNESNPQDYNTYFRLSVTLLEKLVNLKTEMSNVKNFEEFTQAVLEVMDKHLNADQRNAVIEKLKSLGAPQDVV